MLPACRLVELETHPVPVLAPGTLGEFLVTTVEHIRHGLETVADRIAVELSACSGPGLSLHCGHGHQPLGIVGREWVLPVQPDDLEGESLGILFTTDAPAMDRKHVCAACKVPHCRRRNAQRRNHCMTMSLVSFESAAHVGDERVVLGNRFGVGAGSLQNILEHAWLTAACRGRQSRSALEALLLQEFGEARAYRRSEVDFHNAGSPSRIRTSCAP